MSHAVWRKIEIALARHGGALDAGVGEPALSPWALCALVALDRHRRRQQWVGDVVRTHLGGDPKLLARLGAAGHPEHLAQQGDTPGLPGWTYFFHGRGCCLTHAETGASINVDFVDDGRTDAIDPYFFAEYLRSLQRPGPVEARLITLHPSFRTVAVSIAELVEHGLVRAEESGSLASLTAESRAHEALLRELGERLAADGAITEDALARRRGWLRARDRTDTKGSSLRALAETAPDDLATVLSDALEVRPVDARSSIALELIAQQDDPQHCAAVWALFCALDPSGAIPQPHLWARCSAFLLRHAFSVDRVIATLADAGGTEVGEAALLALEFAPPLGRPLLRKALRSPVPISRGVAAATLALLAWDWARAELEALLAETTDEATTSECRAALRSLGDPGGACARWEAANAPAEAAEGALITIAQLVVLGTDERVRDEIERLRERVARLAPPPAGRAPS